MARQIVVHIGLHKTGTRFLQRMVFRQLDPARFNVNPDSLLRPLRAALRSPDYAPMAHEAAAAWRAAGDDRTLVLSEPHISGDMYSSHQDYLDNLALLRELFPEARILFFVRKQSDWLQSAYRQHLVKGRTVPIEVFLNFYDGEFRPRLHRWVYGSRNVEALTLRFLDIYRAYAESYGEERVFLFRQEDLKARGDAVKQRLAEILGLPRLPDVPRERSQNRSYSALAIHLFHPGIRRSRQAPGPDDTGRRARPTFDWLWRKLRRVRRAVIQYGFDRLVYKDWDLLARGGMRERIERHYAREDAELRAIAEQCLAHHAAATSPNPASGVIEVAAPEVRRRSA